MKWTYVSAAVASFVGFLCLPAGAGTKVRVVADGVNLRVAADPQAKVLLQADRDEILDAEAGLNAAWVKVVPPSRATVWVHADLVKDGKVLVKRLRVRAGPGISYKPVGTIARGTKLQSRGSKGDWLMIAPPTNTHVYVSRDYVKPVARPAPPVALPQPVEPDPQPEPEPEPSPEPIRVRPVVVRPAEPGPATRPPVAEAPVPVARPVVAAPRIPPPAKPVVLPERLPVPKPLVAVAGSEAPKALEKKGLDASMEQGKRVTYRGTLKPAGYVWRRPSKYRLSISGRKRNTCYVFGDERALAPWQGRGVEVQGREYWLRGVRHAVVVAESVTEHTP